MCFGPMTKKNSEINTQISFLEIGSIKVMRRRLLGESQTNQEGEVPGTRNESSDYLHGTNCSLALTYPSVHLSQLLSCRLLGLGSREPGLSPDLTCTGWERDTYPCAALTESGECCEEGYYNPLWAIGNLNIERVGVGRMRQMAMEVNLDQRNST